MTSHFNRSTTAQILGVLVSITLYTCAYGQTNDAKLPPNVVARQGGVEVTMQDLDAAAEKIPEKDRAGFFDSPKRIESVIMGLLLQKQLAVAARTDHLDKDPLVQREVAQAADDTLARVQLDHYRKTLKLPDFEQLAKEYYASHNDEFVEKGDVVVEHVLVSNKDRSDQDAKARIDEVEKSAQAHPDQFGSLVAKYSDDPSKERNQGRIANAGGGKMVRPFSIAANALKTPGEISPVVKTEYGYHVLKLIERKPDLQKSFDEAKPQLIAKLKTNFIDSHVTQYSGEMRGKPLQADPDLVASLRTRYMPAGSQTPEEAQQAAATKAAEAGEPKH